MAKELKSALSIFGLAALGSCAVNKADGLPESQPGRTAESLLLAGNVGSGFWPHFAASPEYADDRPEPLNRWSARVLSEIAQAQGGGVVFPFAGPPFYPFQQWAMRTGLFSQSPLGVLAHAEYGLWFAFRGAFLLPDEASIATDAPGGPCESCVDKPCLDACPAGALARGHAYVPDSCRAHVAGAGAETCGTKGCLVRHACPWGQDHAYSREQASFHMRAFIGREPRR